MLRLSLAATGPMAVAGDVVDAWREEATGPPLHSHWSIVVGVASAAAAAVEEETERPDKQRQQLQELKEQPDQQQQMQLQMLDGGLGHVAWL